MKYMVPVDYSEHARVVLGHALALAARQGAEVTVAHVWETQPRVSPTLRVTTPDGRTATISELIAEEAGAAMTEFLGTVPVPAGVKVDRVMLSGAAAEAITGEAARGGFDLIVMGTQGRSGIGRLVLGSVVERVLRTSTVPVLAVPFRRP
ncbi:MAG: universal stress protein [Deltaproteobacteria bacterium]|nr:universal stress protein [Deltaproteobacteria bacterium]